MKNILKKAAKGFTLVELIVVIAIVAILSTVGFVSYTGYLRDSRNSVRESALAESANVITQFIAQNGRAPACASGTTCYFGQDTAVKANAAKTTGRDADLQSSGADLGIADADWAMLNVQKIPEDPRNVYYIYRSNGDDFILYATGEASDGFSSMVAGSGDFDTSIAATLQLDGNKVATGTISAGTACDANDVFITNDNDTDCVPYSFP